MKVDKMDLLETYVRIAELRSLTKAAKELNVAPATISRKLTKLEETIGQTLVRRTTHDISLTKFGDMFLRDAKELILGWLELKYRYHDIDQATMGPLVVVAPACIGHELLTDIAIEFRMSNPGVELFWNLQNESVNFSNMGCHLWLSLGNDIGKNQIRRKIAISKCSLVAAPVCVCRGRDCGVQRVLKDYLASRLTPRVLRQLS